MTAARAVTLWCGLLVACNADPVHDGQVDALGGEVAGVPPGPLHRPGQPCTICHDGRGPGNEEFSVAGTVYQFKDSGVPLSDAIVILEDANKTIYRTATNCAGNFFVDVHDFNPVRPVWVTLQYFTEPEIQIPMSTPLFRTGSCADCHRDPASTTSVGHVYFAPTGNVAFPPSGCP